MSAFTWQHDSRFCGQSFFLNHESVGAGIVWKLKKWKLKQWKAAAVLSVYRKEKEKEKKKRQMEMGVKTGQWRFLRRNLKISSGAIKDGAYNLQGLCHTHTWICFISMGHIHTEEHWQVGVRPETSCPFVLNRYHNPSSVHRMLGWPFLEQRRKTSRLRVMYKICSGLVQCPIIKTKLVPPAPHPLSTA